MTLLNASSLLSTPEFKVPFTFFEKTSTLNEASGYYEQEDSAPVEAFGSIQPVEREELHEVLQNIAGGINIKSAVIVYTSSPLSSGKLGDPSKSGSIVQHKGLDWIVVDVEDYGLNGHVEAIAVRIDGQDD